jgi:hypothetical protein
MAESVSEKLQEIHNWEEVPDFASESEEADYWATHGLAEDFFQPSPESREMMMLKNRILMNLDKLPEDLQKEVLHYAEYLVNRYSSENPKSTETKRGGLGALKGKIWIADDFDDPLEEMKEYME